MRPEGWTLSIGKESQHLSDNISTEHTAFLKVTKTATGVSVALGDDAFAAVTGTPLNQYYTFDTLYFEGPSNGTGFAVDNLRIETNVVPEPSSLLSVLLGAGGLLARRRRVEG